MTEISSSSALKTYILQTLIRKSTKMVQNKIFLPVTKNFQTDTPILEASLVSHIKTITIHPESPQKQHCVDPRLSPRYNAARRLPPKANARRTKEQTFKSVVDLLNQLGGPPQTRLTLRNCTPISADLQCHLSNEKGVDEGQTANRNRPIASQ